MALSVREQVFALLLLLQPVCFLLLDITSFFSAEPGDIALFCLDFPSDPLNHFRINFSFSDLENSHRQVGGDEDKRSVVLHCCSNNTNICGTENSENQNRRCFWKNPN